MGTISPPPVLPLTSLRSFTRMYEPSVKPGRASESRASAGETDSDAAGPRLHLMSHSKTSQISAVTFSSPPFVDLVLHPHSLTSRSVRRCPRAGRRSPRCFPDWEKKSRNGKGGFPRAIPDHRGSQRKEPTSGEHAHKVCRCLAALPFIYTHCEATNLQGCGCCI